MNRLLIFIFILLMPVQVLAGTVPGLGVGYLSKAEGTKVYASSTEDKIDLIVDKDFPFLAWNGSSMLFNWKKISSEDYSDGRLHVRYFVNGKDSSDGENTAWVNPKDVLILNFGCCGAERCSGVESNGRASVFSECFKQSVEAKLGKTDKHRPHHDSASEIEKLRLQLEIEKTRLKTERLKSYSKP